MNMAVVVAEEIIDPLRDIIVHITDAMKADFGQQYAKLYADKEELRQFKRRLYSKLKGSTIVDIKNAYEAYVNSGNPFCPTIPNLLAFIINAEKDRKKAEKNAVESARIAALPPPTIECNPVEILAKARADNSVFYTEEERAIRHQENLRRHEMLLQADSHKIRHIYADPSHFCNVDGCTKAGSFSSGTRGDGNFYCSSHYRMAN